MVRGHWRRPFFGPFGARSNENVTLTEVQKEAALFDNGDLSSTDDRGEPYDFLTDEREFWHVYEKPGL